MANLKEIRNRITSVKSTRQITSAMKMVSAAKLRRAQDAIVQLRPYAQKLQEILGNVSASLDASEGIYSEQRETNNILLVAVTSNRGLCGGFNANIIKAVKKYIAEEKNANVSVLCVGKKGFDIFKKTPNIVASSSLKQQLNYLFDELTYDNVSKEAENIMSSFVNKEFDKVFIIYNQFKNAAVQEVVFEQFLPIVANNNNQSSATDYIFEPNKAFIIEELIPKSLKTQFFKALLDSHASEHGARMTAMHKATDNATELINELTLSYNKARQAAITGEILEIVAGAEALN
ncbi:MAG: ATP synthase F1 subunit gamma [Vicingaceae bacterium]